MVPQFYRFDPMTAADLPLVRRWLGLPHVKEWWGDTPAQFKLDGADSARRATDQFIVSTGNRRLGYLQCYDQNAWPGNGLGVHPAGTRGIDQFIGEPDMVNRGHGSAFIRTFADGLIAAGAPRVLADPDPANGRAMRAYEKAGFRRDREVETPDGPAMLMVRDA